MRMFDLFRGSESEPEKREGVTDSPLRRAITNIVESMGAVPGMPSSGLLSSPILTTSALTILARLPDRELERGVLMVHGLVNELLVLLPEHATGKYD